MNIFTVVAEDDSDLLHRQYFPLCAFIKEQDALDFIEAKKVQQLEAKLNAKKLAEFYVRWEHSNPCPGMQSQVISRNSAEEQARYKTWFTDALTAQQNYARSLRIAPPTTLVFSGYFVLQQFSIKPLVLHGL